MYLSGLCYVCFSFKLMFSLLCVKYDMFMHEMMMSMYKLFCRFGLKENALNRVVTTKVVQVKLDVKTLLQRTQEEAGENEFSSEDPHSRLI
jgi:DNA-binding Xre family transcriptional regulator